MQHVQFFLDEMKASNFEFQLSEALEIVEALNKNHEMSLEEKHQFWD